MSGRVNEPILTNATDQERRLEERVKELCERVEGVSDVNVLIVVDTISENIYAENVQTRHSDGSDEVRREFAGGSDSPIKIGERNATVRGAAVVCKGGDDPALKLKLTSLISAALGIPSSSVSVVGSG